MGHFKNMPNSHSPLLKGENIHPIPCPITLNKTSTNSDKNAPSQTLVHFPHLYLLPPLYPSEHQCKIFNDSCNLCVRTDIPSTFMNIIKNYSNIFSTNKYNIPKLKIPPINIRTNSDKIIALRPYRTSLSDQREIQEQVGKMLEYDIIEPSFSPYSSPVTLVTKRDKTKRFCVDYRRLNEIIFPDVHPLPLIENILDKLANAKIYSRADFSSAYWSIEISPPDRNLLSFVTLEGQYNFKRLPYGIKIGPQVYERAVSQILQRNRLGFIAHYFDDIIIFSNSIEEHLDHLQQFFDMCNRENFRLNYNKCDFFKTTIESLGYTISSGTYTPLVKNLDVINAIKVPTSVKSLQSFLGSINVYNKFIKDHARIRNPLNNLLKKDTPWHWDTKCHHSFDTLKECLTTKPVLHLFKEGLPCQLFCDASLQGIAGILKQQHPDGTLHPVQYYSRALRPHEKKYTITELECLAVIDSVEKFRIYLADLNNHLNPYPNIIESRKLAIQRTNDRHDKEKLKYDNKHKNPHFDTGYLVLVKAYHHPNSDSPHEGIIDGAPIVWESRAQQTLSPTHVQWPQNPPCIGYKNIVNLPLIDSENVYLPPLHIKLGLMKNFVKAMDRNASGFAYLKQKFSSISETKIKEGIFVGPQIRELQQDGKFQNSLNEVEAAACNSFRKVCKFFLGSVKVENYRDIVNDLLLSYKALGFNMSLKIHFLRSHLDFFPDNLRS
ncbi:K02A2.6-like [Cordylochernes scorpioides]|uniref:K02A2.6-like n=1 Tax=Cordylochernes scorpioides TaxID=51811 RepID=A0ABY6KSW2_9ARAC|nr:K02A2.6-like [Cordylochernes scorpioides]